MEGRAERAEVVMVADALDLDPLAVQKEAARGVEPDRADAEDRLVAVNDSAALLDGRDGRVEARPLRAPKLRRAERRPRLGRQAPARFEAQRRGRHRSDGTRPP